MMTSALVFVLTTLARTRRRQSAKQWRSQEPETTKITPTSAGEGEKSGGRRGESVVATLEEFGRIRLKSDEFLTSEASSPEKPEAERDSFLEVEDDKVANGFPVEYTGKRRQEGDDEKAYGMKKRTKERTKRIKQQRRRMRREREGSRRDASSFGPDQSNSVLRFHTISKQPSTTGFHQPQASTTDLDQPQVFANRLAPTTIIHSRVTPTTNDH